MTDDPNWPRADAWLRGEHGTGDGPSLAVVGLPIRLGSISGGAFDLAPVAVRAALGRYSTYDGEDDVDVRALSVSDAGDVDLAGLRPEDALDPAMAAVRDAFEGRDAVVSLGGDNSVTRPAVQGLGIPLERIGLLTLDAHHDLRDTTDGLTNGNPVRALLEDGLPGRNVAQIGIQGFANSAEYARVAVSEGVTVFTADRVHREGIDEVVESAISALPDVDAIHVDLDVDVLDRAFAPACPGSRPGGLSPSQVRRAIRRLAREPRVWGMDLVEVDPDRDVADTTVLAAASFVLSFASGLARRPRT